MPHEDTPSSPAEPLVVVALIAAIFGAPSLGLWFTHLGPALAAGVSVAAMVRSAGPSRAQQFNFVVASICLGVSLAWWALLLFLRDPFRFNPG